MARLCDGSAVSADDQVKIANAGLASVWNNVYGLNTYPNLEGKVIAGVSSSHSMGSITGSATKIITESNLPSHNHPFTTGNNSRGHTHGSGTYKTAEGATTNDYATSAQAQSPNVPAATSAWETDNGSDIGGSGDDYPKQDGGGFVSLTTRHNHDTPSVDVAGISSTNSLTHTHTGTTGNKGSGNAISNMQPTGFMGNYFIWVGV